VEKKVLDAPETRLKLTLRGVFASEDSSGGRAIVGDPQGKEENYAVGDPLPGGAKLSEIYPDRIILERNGRFETLRLPKERTQSSRVMRTIAVRCGRGLIVLPSRRRRFRNTGTKSSGFRRHS